MRAATVTAPSVSESAGKHQQRNAQIVSGSGMSRQERRSSLGLRVGDAFNPFCLFDGALVPSEILRSPDILPSEKLVFARLMQFAGGKGKAWPSIERIAEEVALSVPQARRCVSSLQSKGFIRRLARSGRSNEFEFLWHAMYEQEPRSPVIAVPRSPASDLPQSCVIGPGHSGMIAGEQSPKIGPGRSSVTARRESIESSSSQEIQFEKNQRRNGREPLPSKNLIDDDFAHRRGELDEPEQEFLLRLQERDGESVDRHAILQSIAGDLKSYSDLKAFLDFEQKQTTAPHKLKNPAGHYRCTVGKFYEARAKRRDWDIRSEMKALEAKISGSTGALKDSRTCSLGHCNGTGECWDERGLVAPCACEIGQQLPAKVLAAFEQMNALPRGSNGVFQ
ncbi:MAG: helix-turn-helix domain-containing protein [Bryobacteraceae bacterium]